MTTTPDFRCFDNQAAAAVRRVLDARMNGELSDDEFVRSIRSACTHSEFVAAISSRINAEPQSLARIMELLNRLSHRSDVPADLIGLIESRISRGRPADVAATVDPHPPAQRVVAGSVLRERYEIDQCLGSGGTGTVFKALDRYRMSQPGVQRYVAIKILHERAGNRDEMVEALRRELQSAQTLSHPNIVKVYDVDRDGEVDFFTMELLEGELLSTLMRRFQAAPMPRPHAWTIIRQIASGLEHAHSRKIVHADLKPQNIMITNSGEVRILDFGSSYRFSKDAQAAPSWHGSSSATPAYACCELLDGRTPDPRDDLYALACIAYELLTGAHPFQRRRASEVRDFGVVPTRPSGLTRRQWRSLAKGLSWHRAGRSISVGDWFKELKPGSDHAEPLASIGELNGPAVRAHRMPPIRPFAVFSVVLCIAAISLLFVRLAPGGRVSGAALSASAPQEYTGRTADVGEATNAGPPRSASAMAAISTQRHDSSILPSEYRVQPGEHFAEIRVHRAANAGRDAPLTWWTESASAKPGVDYVSQAKVSLSFPSGQDSMSVFVKLFPKAKRSEPEVFYVATTNGGDRHSGETAHTAVRLPASGVGF
jgi:serine/threonine protein kinase